MHISTHAPGSFCWFELATTDQPAAKNFYQSLFGWQVEDFPMGPNESYSMFRLDGRDVGAAVTLRPEWRAQGTPPHWMAYIATADADASASRAGELGGTVLAPPFDVMAHGRMAIVRDPTGATFSLWQPKAHQGTGIVNVPGVVVWADLRTSDQERAAAFYRGLFGWKTTAGTEHQAAKPGDYYHVLNGTDYIGGIPPADEHSRRAPAHWLLYFGAADCAASTTKAKSLGARAFVENMVIGENGSISVLADPQGAPFALHQRK